MDLKSKVPLTRSNEKYKILVQRGITNLEGQSLREKKMLNIGFDIHPVTVEFGELV